MITKMIRKIRCDCGGILASKIVRFKKFETKALVCPKCNYTGLSMEQAKKYVELKQLHQTIDAERKIIKIGNSMGITLPDALKEFGVKVGQKVKTEALGPKSFKVELIG
ncbi:MAG TPA: hypothetical protein VJG90_04740 [Candidatus Nanoarchaeia archaeon]|nr:hypothetical protein [Candidatus Nanoarchaeia archaeon]